MKKPIYKKWWFWVIIGVVVVVILGASTDDAGDAGTGAVTTGEVAGGTSNSGKTYQQVDIQTLLDELKENALRAETKYQNAYVEFTGKISNIDSDGAYINVESVNAGEWNFETIQCYIKSKDQKNFIIEKSVGDTVTIKGKITSIGEVLGYSVNIDSIS